VLYSFGDYSAQYLESAYGVQSTGKTEYNVERTLRMGTFGLFFAGPILGLWYSNLHRMTGVYRYCFVPVQTSASQSSFITAIRGSYQRQMLNNKSDTVLEVLVKVVFDNLLFQATFLNLYLFTMSFMEGRSVQEAYQRCKRDFHDAWGYSMLFWVPFQTLNFCFVPPAHHALFVNVFNMMWKTFLSLLYHNRDYGTPNILKEAAPVEKKSLLSWEEAKMFRTLHHQATELHHQVKELERDEARLSEARRQQVLVLLNLVSAQSQLIGKLMDKVKSADR